MRPVLATLVDALPGTPDDWLFEVKFDGYRLLARIDSRELRLITRNGHHWTSKLPHVTKGLASLKLKPGWLDGEIVVPGERSGTSFQELQNAFESARARDIVFYLFDIPFYNGYDLTRVLKTSGGNGLHVVTPIRRQYEWDTVKDFSQGIVGHLARTLPQLLVAKSGAKNRVGRIYVDYLRNGFGATTVSAWSVRARPGLGVSVPVSWAELASLKSAAQWTVRNVGDRLEIGNAPWKDYSRSARSITPAMKHLDTLQSRRVA